MTGLEGSWENWIIVKVTVVGMFVREIVRDVMDAFGRGGKRSKRGAIRKGGSKWKRNI